MMVIETTLVTLLQIYLIIGLLLAALFWAAMMFRRNITPGEFLQSVALGLGIIPAWPAFILGLAFIAAARVIFRDW
jgi:hypothetical protein